MTAGAFNEGVRYDDPTLTSESAPGRLLAPAAWLLATLLFRGTANLKDRDAGVYLFELTTREAASQE